MGTPPESTLPSLPPPTPTVLSPLWSALSPPLWFVPWLLLLSVLMCPPLWCPTLPPLSTLESTLEFTPESTLLESTPDSPPSTATTTATTTASARLRLSPTPLARFTLVFPLSTPTLLATPPTLDTPATLMLTTATATPATTTDKSSNDSEPKPIGPNVAPWWRKPIVLLTCVTCAMN